MSDLLDGAAGERLEPAAYYAEFEARFWSTREPGFWKLERLQDYQEPGHDSWEAFSRGDWAGSLRLLDASRDDMGEFYRRVAEKGFVARRVRVVEEPLTPYVQWEMHALRIRDECGDTVHILHPGQVAVLEATGPLPDLITLGGSVMYQVVCTDGVLRYARRFTEPDLVRRGQRLIRDLYEAGQPLADYFPRQVAPLPPPDVRR